MVPLRRPNGRKKEKAKQGIEENEKQLLASLLRQTEKELDAISERTEEIQWGYCQECNDYTVMAVNVSAIRDSRRKEFYDMAQEMVLERWRKRRM